MTCRVVVIVVVVMGVMEGLILHCHNFQPVISVVLSSDLNLFFLKHMKQRIVNNLSPTPPGFIHTLTEIFLPSSTFLELRPYHRKVPI